MTEKSDVPNPQGSAVRHFSYRATVIFRAIIWTVPIVAGLGGWITWAGLNSPYTTHQDITLQQPIPFSHLHHVQGIGLDCRFCHASVDKSSFAGMPSTKTCMTCHSQVWTNAPMLKPVRDSWREGKPIQWVRVHNLPDFVFFNHEAHVTHGMGCVTCHGQVDDMPLMRQASPLTMAWCLNCHRNPEKYVRPREEVFNMRFKPEDINQTQASLGPKLVDQYHIRSARNLTDCATCHR